VCACEIIKREKEIEILHVNIYKKKKGGLDLKKKKVKLK
jgi:hypothetical protein